MEYSKTNFEHLGEENITRAINYFFYHNYKGDKQIKVADVTRNIAIAILQNCTYAELVKCRLTFISAKDFFNDNHKTHKMIEVFHNNSKRVLIVER